MKQKNLTFPSTSDSLHLVESLIDEISAEMHLDEDYYGNILIAVTEAVNNAINHGNKQDPNKTVSFVFTENDDHSITFRITDQGTGFDFENIPDPTAPENIEKVNGRGVFLMKQLSDGVTFDDNGRVVELSFKLAQHA
ncbi:MAG: ATP-binding protein [Bacteroidia bacterium]